ncbi:MAG: amidohydrolase family protein [Phycisphaerales bacterium]|nr:amidohydrolase family protein [Phycisphaerales bacterium]
MMTGLREAHAHIVHHARAAEMVRLEGCGNKAELLDRVRERAGVMQGEPPERWLLGSGMRVQGWSDPEWPDVAELDAAAGARPCCVWSFDLHALAANTAALSAAGFNESSGDPEGGRIARDRHTGRMTGVLLESAAKRLWSAVPEPRGEERVRLVRKGLVDLSRHGFTGIHDLVSEAWLGPVLADLADRGELPARVTVYPPLAMLEDVARTAPAWEREEVRLGGGKVFADGTLNARTAWMLSAYADPLPGLRFGQCMMTAAALKDAMGKAWSLGVGLAVHAIGDAAVRATLDAFEQSPERRRAGRGGLVRGGLPLLRIEHAEIIDETDVPRFARLGVACSVQPCHLLTDIEALRRGLPHRLDRVLPLRELIDSGCEPGRLLWFGSDTPIVRPDPGDSVQAAVHRRRAGDGDLQAIAMEQAITEEEAWAAFRSGGVTE